MGKATCTGNGIRIVETEFFAMDGYAFYVWGSYGLSAVILIANAMLPRIREKSLLKRIARGYSED